MIKLVHTTGKGEKIVLFEAPGSPLDNIMEINLYSQAISTIDNGFLCGYEDGVIKLFTNLDVKPNPNFLIHGKEIET